MILTETEKKLEKALEEKQSALKSFISVHQDLLKYMDKNWKLQGDLKKANDRFGKLFFSHYVGIIMLMFTVPLFHEYMGWIFGAFCVFILLSWLLVVILRFKDLDEEERNL